MSGISLYVPEFDDLWYRQRMMSDPDTMSYNAGYDLGFGGYHPDTGCIDFPKENWRSWYDRFVHCEPERFYAYVVREDGMYVGEVVLRREGEPYCYEMGVVIEARHRGCGYSVEALDLLMVKAFAELDAKRVVNSFESSRSAALKLHTGAGFSVVGEKDGLLRLELKREACLALKKFG